ncbi:MAG: (deoxy)nucleoside triphosphate pyrophosphohydrolase [Longimicrobiales bacterium]
MEGRGSTGPGAGDEGAPGIDDSAGNEQTIPVVAAVVERDGAYLLALRPGHKRHGGLWEFPGGKVASGESDADALERELAEELGVKVASVGSPLFGRRDPGTPFSIRFLRVKIHGEPRAREHDEVRWVRAAELPTLPLAPVDRRFVLEVLG